MARRRFWLGLLVCASPWLLVSPGRAAEKHALLVGCTEYKNNTRIPPLRGPVNDVRMWKQFLTDPKGFAFPAAHVTTLVGTDKDDPASRPTRANIAKAYEALIAKAGPGSQVFILMSGHGTQQPIPESQADPLDPRNPEPDGLDEVFLPADAGEVGPEGIKNSIKDDEVGAWLAKLRDKGAFVWIVFDHCHSGTMTRSVPGPVSDIKEVNRTADPVAIGVPQKAIDDAVKRAEEAVKKAREMGKDPLAAGEKIKPKPSKGSLVAFYAAQPFEEAPELPLPEGVPHTSENYYGMLSYTVVQAVLQRRSPISYRQLAQQVAFRYRGARATRPPTPFAEGDLDREVLGLTEWPKRAEFLLERDKAELRLNAGELLGLTKDAILAVHPPAGAGGAPDEVLGHVQVVSVTPARAVVKPCAFAGKAAVEAGKLPDLGRCAIVQRDYGEMKVKVFCEGKGVRAALDGMAKEATEMVSVVAKPEDAEWSLRLLTPKQAKDEFGLDEKEPLVYLLQGQGRSRNLPAEKQAAELLQKTGRPVPRKIFGRYPLYTQKQLGEDLAHDLPKIFKWQNIWRVASGVAADEERETHDLKFEVVKIKDKNDRTGGEALRDGVVRDGQWMEYRVKNEGQEDLWVTILYLDSNLAIDRFWSGGIRKNQAMRPMRRQMSTDKGASGLEGMVVFAIPQKAQKDPPQFDFLAQDPLQVVEAMKGIGDPDGAEKLSSPFGKLLSGAAFNRGTRGMASNVDSTPAVFSQAWVMVPAK